MANATHVAVLVLAGVVDGRMRRYATAEQAQAAVDTFRRGDEGGSVEVDRVEDAAGVWWRVSCPSQRGQFGAMRLHAIACGFGVPVHLE